MERLHESSIRVGFITQPPLHFNKLARLSSGFFMSGVRDRDLNMSVGWDNTSKKHNYTTRRSLGSPGKRIYFIKIGQVGDLNRGLEAGFSPLAWGKNTQR